MHTSQINIGVHLDDNKVPQQITWNATDSTANMEQAAKAMMLAFWDGTDKSALRIDLWTKEMMVDEMNDFFYQTFYGMADTYLRATRNEELANEMKQYAKSFLKKASDALEKDGK